MWALYRYLFALAVTDVAGNHGLEIRTCKNSSAVEGQRGLIQFSIIHDVDFGHDSSINFQIRRDNSTVDLVRCESRKDESPMMACRGLVAWLETESVENHTVTLIFPEVEGSMEGFYVMQATFKGTHVPVTKCYLHVLKLEELDENSCYVSGRQQRKANYINFFIRKGIDFHTELNVSIMIRRENTDLLTCYRQSDWSGPLCQELVEWLWTPGLVGHRMTMIIPNPTASEGGRYQMFVNVNGTPDPACECEIKSSIQRRTRVKRSTGNKLHGFQYLVIPVLFVAKTID